MTQLTDPVRLGVIVGARGIKGEVRIKSFTDAPEDIAAYGPLFDREGTRRFDLKVTGTQKGLVLARFDGVTDRNGADALKRTELFIDADQLPDPDADEFYHRDLEGLDAVTVTGDGLGRIRGVFDFGAGPVLELDDGIMVPFTQAAVPEIDLKARRVVIDPPDGLFETPEPEAESDKGSDDDVDKSV